MLLLRRFSLIALSVVLAAFPVLLHCSKKNPVSTQQQAPAGNVDQSGGTVVSGDISLVFPPNAVTGKAEVWIKTVAPSTFFTADTLYNRTVVSCSSSVAFSGSVQLRVPVPAGMTVADSARLIAGSIEDSSGLVTVYPAKVQVDTASGKVYAVLSVPHFSNWLYEWFRGPTPPASAGPLSVPYYNQNPTPFCWATCIHMITQAAAWNEESQVNDIVGPMQIDDSGLYSGLFRNSALLAKIIKDRTGFAPERDSWDPVNIELMKQYVQQEIGVRGHPVALFEGHKSHVITLVGYDGNNFIVNDPASTTNSAIGYRVTPWDTLLSGFSLGSNMVTVVVPAPHLDPARQEVTVSIASGAFRLIHPTTGPGDPSKFYLEKWSYQRKSGYAMFENGGTLTDTMPAGISQMEQPSDVNVCNISQTETKSVSVWLDLGPVMSGTHPAYSQQLSLTLAPNSLNVANFGTIPGAQFLDTVNPDASPARQYLLSVRVLENGNVVGRSFFNFYIRSKVPTITGIYPPSALLLTNVTVKGKYFGNASDVYNVIFGYQSGHDAVATVVSWCDTAIVVKVPATAVTGNVVIKGKTGSFVSSGVPFTVLDNTAPCTVTVYQNLRNSDSVGIWGLPYKIHGTYTAKAQLCYTMMDSLDTLRGDMEVFLEGKHTCAINGTVVTTFGAADHLEYSDDTSKSVIDLNPVVFRSVSADPTKVLNTTTSGDSCTFRYGFNAATDWISDDQIFDGWQIVPYKHWTRTRRYTKNDSLIGTDTGSISFGFLQIGCWRYYRD